MRRLIFTFLLLSPIWLYAQPIASFTTNSDIYCAGDSVFFINNSTNAVSYHWFFGDGTDTWIQNPFHIYNDTGNFHIKLIAYDTNGLKDSTEKNITVHSTPKVNIINEEQNKILIARLTNSAQLQWFFNNIYTNQSDSIIYYYESGIYKVIATNTYGCKDSDSVHINLNIGNNQLSDSLAINVLNNILTPDVQDGINDYLFIKDLATYKYPCSVFIYDKYGKQVYSNQNYTNIGGFNGTDNNGKKLPTGTYYYIIRSQGRKTQTGYIDIIR